VERARTVRRLPPEVLVLLLFGAAPFLSLLGHPGALLADPGSEYPVKLWAYETFARVGLLGGRVDVSAFPYGGPLNNADIVGTLVTRVVRPLVGRVAAYDVVVLVQLEASLLATWLLARDLVQHRGAALLAAVAFVLTPMVLVYCVAGAVTDMLSLWPYPLAIRAFLRGGTRNGALAGAWLAAGVVTCAYNVVVFAAIVVPAAFFVPLWGRGIGRGSLLRTLAGCGLVAIPLIGAYAAWLAGITGAPDAQVSAVSIAATRHVAPYPYLHPLMPDRYTLFLADYVAVGKSALIEREAGSRYLRACSPGISLLLLALGGTVAMPRKAGLWAAVAVWCAMASLGPFFPLNGAWYASVAVNPAWLLLNGFMPGANLLLEPFRYALPAALALAICAAYGLSALVRRFGGWVVPVALAVWTAELVFVSPVPVPLPIVVPTVDEAYARLGDLPPGALVELPFFDAGSNRFNRVHFLNQLVHGRPIPDEVLGAPPRAYKENAYLGALVHAEKPMGRIRVDPEHPERADADREKLATEGYAAIVVDPGGFANEHRRDEVLTLLAPLGAPLRLGGRLVYPVPR
jgi:hypothetical protein